MWFTTATLALVSLPSSDLSAPAVALFLIHNGNSINCEAI